MSKVNRPVKRPSIFSRYFSWIDAVDAKTCEQVAFIKSWLSYTVKRMRKIIAKGKYSDEDIRVAEMYISLMFGKLLGGEIKDKVRLRVVSDPRNQELSEAIRGQVEQAVENWKEPIKMSDLNGLMLAQDALTYDFGSSRFLDKLRTGLNMMQFHFNPDIDGLEWYVFVQKYMAHHLYFSPFVQRKRIEQKVKNNLELIHHIQELRDGSSLVNNKRAMTVIKTASRNQVDLISIADKKAGIMITVNSILLSILIPIFASYIFDFSGYILPITILILTCGATIILATLATKPTMEKDVDQEEFASGNKSIFHFKNFSGLSKDDFMSNVHDVVSRSGTFERTVYMDLYDVGMDLDRKYKWLKVCYTVFIVGILLTVVTFLFSAFYFQAT